MQPAADKAKYYAQMQITTSAKPRLICMLHDRCVHLIRQSLESDPATAAPLILNAQNILAQLERSLKRSDDVSDGLFYLYDFCYCSLEKQDSQSRKTAMDIMIVLRDTFETLLKN